MAIKIDYDKCCWKDGACSTCNCDGGCDATHGGCLDMCAVGALTRADKLVVDESTCIDCGACIMGCKHGALSM